MNSVLRTLTLVALAALLLTGAAYAAELIEDHQEIEGPFTDGPSVTATCLECHDDVAHDFMQTSHWTWEPMQDVIGRGEIPLGKKNEFNNYCIALDSNWARCTSCHAGYGWQDADFDFDKPENIDCLICHDQSGTYRKFPTGAGHPTYEPREWAGKIWEPLDLPSIARTVGKPTRQNCGACHFFGGMGNNVKHGDLEKALIDPPLALDVHMSAEGEDFSCQDCHTTESHNIAGNGMYTSPGGDGHIACVDCHDSDVHEKRVLNWHTQSVACQTCHVPTFARANPTKMWWDWSTAGTNLKSEKNKYGQETFNNKTGSFKWATNVVPGYAWYNGTSGHYLRGDKMNPNEPTRLNWPTGNRLDPKAMIMPFKVMHGKQVYDAKLNTILVPKLFGEGGFWSNGFDWQKALELGTAAAGQEFSGEYGFAATESWWKINHMVAPATDALRCKACHAKDGSGRMDWQALGYKGDPAHKRGLSRYELKEAYQDLNE